MPTYRFVFPACLAIATLLASACMQAGIPVTAPSTPVAVATAPGVVVTGLAVAPKGIVGKVVPVGGGHVVPTGGGHLFRTLEVSQSPLAGATVFLADAAGQPYPSLPSTTTDASGRFTFTDVPAGHTYMVVAAARDDGRQKDVTLQTLVRSDELGATTRIDVATSLITLAVSQGQGDLGEFNAAAFRTATEATARKLTDADLPDLSDRSAIIAKMDELAAQVAELKDMLEQIRGDLQEIKESLAKIGERLDRPNGGMRPAVGPNGGEGMCTRPLEHELELTGTYEGYPLELELIAPHGQVMFTFRIEKAGDVGVGLVPEICPNEYRLTDARGKVLATAPGFAIPRDAPRRVKLPL